MTLSVQPSRSGARSFAAWLGLVLLLGVGHVVPALHFLLVAHRLCAEHGELVDVAAESVEAVQEKAPSRANSASGCAVTSGSAAHTHEHCGVPAWTSAASTLALPSETFEQLPAALVAGAAGGARSAHIDIELLHYAPKLAPPASVSSRAIA